MKRTLIIVTGFILGIILPVSGIIIEEHRGSFMSETFAGYGVPVIIGLALTTLLYFLFPKDPKRIMQCIIFFISMCAPIVLFLLWLFIARPYFRI